MAEQVLQVSGVGTGGWQELAGKECRTVNILQILCTHAYKCKNDNLLKPFQDWEKVGIKEKGEGVNLSMIFLIHCQNLCKFHNVIPC
jgi:hypothetical protein